MLRRLRNLLHAHGYLSGLVIDEAEGLPSSSAYQSRFGSLLRAYQLIGFTPGRDYRYVDINRALRRLHPNVVTEAVAKIVAFAATVRRDPSTDLLTINEEFTASLVIARCMTMPSGAFRWKVRLDAGLRPDITIALRMEPENIEPRDYYLLPRIAFTAARIGLNEENGIFLDAYRFDSLDAFFQMTARTDIRKAA